MKSKYLLLLLFLLLSACDVDYVYYSTYRIQNNSSYDIEIRPNGSLILEEPVRIKKGETFSLSMNGDGGYPGIRSFAPTSCIIKFGDQATTIHRTGDKDAYHNFCHTEAYMRKKVKTRTEVFTFTFTDADYEYAREHPVTEPE